MLRHNMYPATQKIRIAKTELSVPFEADSRLEKLAPINPPMMPPPMKHAASNQLTIPDKA